MLERTSKGDATSAPPQASAALLLAPLSREKILFLSTGLASTFLIGLSGQFPAVNIADIQGGLFATADEASWVLTSNAMASFAGIVASVPLIKALGVRRFLAASLALFAAMSLACAAAPGLAVMTTFRTLQGFAAGGVGPAAFVSVFMTTGGPRLPFGITMLASALLLPNSFGPIASALIESNFGWRALFLAQAGVGVILAMAAAANAPRQTLTWSALNTDWTAIFLLSTALASMTLVLSQGARRFWFDNELIAWSAAASIGAWAGFLYLTRISSAPIMNLRLLLTRKFGVPIALHFMMRVSLVLASFLVPQFLAIVHGYRPLEIAGVMAWAAIPQLLALPLIWRLMHILDARIVMALGLFLGAAGAGLLVDGTAASNGDQFRLALMTFGLGQAFLLPPTMVVGTSMLNPPDLPTASLAFNITMLGGATFGAGVGTHLATEREKFHSNVLTERISIYDPFDADRITTLVEALADRTPDEADAVSQAASLISMTARREAWVLSYNDAFLLVAVCIAVSALALLAIGRAPPLRRASAAGE